MIEFITCYCIFRADWKYFSDSFHSTDWQWCVVEIFFWNTWTNHFTNTTTIRYISRDNCVCKEKKCTHHNHTLYQFISHQVSSTGLISFGARFFSYYPRSFPIPQRVIAPFWESNALYNIQRGYTHYTIINSSHSTLSELLPPISEFISTREEIDFMATWIAVVRWVNTCPLFGPCVMVSIHG